MKSLKRDLVSTLVRHSVPVCPERPDEHASLFWLLLVAHAPAKVHVGGFPWPPWPMGDDAVPSVLADKAPSQIADEAADQAACSHDCRGGFLRP